MKAQDPIDFYEHRGTCEGPGEPVGLARFLWTDPESGEELSVEVRGEERFFMELEAIGFRRVGESGADEPRRSEGERRSVRVHVRAKGGERSTPRARRGA